MKKNIKFGFTLVEAIIALSIVGVLAAFVLPPLFTGAQNKRHAAMLGRSVELIETGCQNLVQSMNELSNDGSDNGHYMVSPSLNGFADDFNDGIVYNSKLFDYAADYFNLTNFEPDDIYKKSVRGFHGEAPEPELSAIADKYALNPKLGTYYGVKYLKGDFYTNNELLFGDPDELHQVVAELIYIDVNGANSPNRYGRDIFLFELNNMCHMIPAGSGYISIVTGQGVPIEEEACKGNNIKNGLSCTSRVVKAGYKMEY